MASTTSGASVIAGAVAEANGTEVPLTKRSGPVTLVRLVVSGNAIAVSFASDGAAGVAIVDIRDEVLQIGKKAAEANETKIDYYANFAGVVGPCEKVVDQNVEDFMKCQAVNSTGVFLCTKHEMRQMMKQSSIKVEKGRVPVSGSIVNCASVNSLQSMPGTTTYTASKHACHDITKAAALEGRKHGIRVNAVSPGFLLTDMVKPMVMGQDGSMFGKSPNALWQHFE